MRAIWTCRCAAWLLASVTMCAAGACATASPRPDAARAEQPASYDPGALDAFAREIEKYSTLHRRLARALPPRPTQASEEAVRAHEVALEQLISAERVQAQEGDVFVAEIRPLIRGVCRDLFAGRDGRSLLATIREEASERAIRARVNQHYPDGMPLSSMPFRLLIALPALPDELRYRFLGNDLILLDSDARIVIDVLRDVLPR